MAKQLLLVDQVITLVVQYGYIHVLVMCWSQQGNKLVGTGGTGVPPNTQKGFWVSLSANGNTAIFGGPYDNNQQGAAWIFTRSGGVESPRE